jgi:hypothetical protein
MNRTKIFAISTTCSTLSMERVYEHHDIHLMVNQEYLSMENG